MASPPIPNRPNPKPRNSETADPLRRSFGGNPFPVNPKVNISSDVTRRNSFGGRDFSDKENETKALPTPPKCSKNFMSPTISAVSKINPSPRKRVLSDKNQVSRSLSSDVKGLTFEEDSKPHHQAKHCVSFSDVIHIIGTVEKKPFERPHDMTVTDFDEDEVHEDKGIVYSDPRFRISPRPSVPYTSPEFTDREVDPLLPPYDPKKNYLSPRPQFLHYRPNPRIEKPFDECKQLEELFISESSSSDAELSVEEKEKDETEAVVVEEATEETEKYEKQEKDASHKGVTEAVVKEETEDVEELEAESSEEIVCESIEETSQVPKQSGFRTFRFLGWCLALAMASMLVSVTFSPPTELLKESAFYKVHVPEFAKANNLEELSGKLWTFTESSLVFMDKLISSLGGGTEEYAPLQFHNLSYTLEENTVFLPTSVEINEEPLEEKVRGENNLEEDHDHEHETEDESGGEENSQVVSEIEDDDAESNEVDEQAEMTPGTDIESNEGEENLDALVIEEPEVNLPEVYNDVKGLESQEKLETGSTRQEQDEKEAESEALFINQHDVETAAIKMHQQNENVLANAESGLEEGLRETAVEPSDDLHANLQQSDVADAESESEDCFSGISAETSDALHPELQQSEMANAEGESEDGLGEMAAEPSDDVHPKTMIVLSSTLLVLLAAVAFLFTKKAKHVAASASEPAPETEEPVKNLMKEKLTSPNVQAEEEEVDDRTSNSVHKKNSSLSNSQSLGGSSKLRRESMASSASEYSVGSFSYGSFTTYEKIPIKTGDREEEMVTPVRRSSRIRNHHQHSGQ